MKTIFTKSINGKQIVVDMKETTNSLWLTVDGKDHGHQDDVYGLSSTLWSWYQINIRGMVAREIGEAARAAENPNPAPRPEPVNMVEEARRSGDINKFAKGGAL